MTPDWRLRSFVLEFFVLSLGCFSRGTVWLGQRDRWRSPFESRGEDQVLRRVCHHHFGPTDEGIIAPHELSFGNWKIKF